MKITLDPQINPDNGRTCKLIGTKRLTDLPLKYINGEYRFCTRHDFKYLDKEGGYFSIELDYNNKLLNRKTI
jgi:predicted membrane-bound spermidine synthase